MNEKSIFLISLLVLLFDIGSGLIKSGFSTDISPRYTIPNLVGKYEDEFLYNEKIFKNCEDCEIIKPIREGIINNKEIYEKSIDFVIDNLLNISCEDYHFIFSEKLYCDPRNREDLVDIAFDYYNIPSLTIYPQPLLALYGTGFTSGCVVDIGEDLSQICCFFEGIPLDSFSVVNFGGSNITTELAHQLSYRLYDNITEPSHRLYVEKCKELYGYISLDYENELESYSSSADREKSYVLPDKTLIALNQERINASEIIFNPSLYEESRIKPLHERVVNAIYKCDTSLRKLLFSNVVLSGGSTLFPNFEERLTNEMKLIAPTAPPITIRSIENRINSVWKGESIISNFSNVKRMTIKDYKEYGSHYINDICINED